MLRIRYKQRQKKSITNIKKEVNINALISIYVFKIQKKMSEKLNYDKDKKLISWHKKSTK